ncbi:hypothetical protein BC827DRAFT_1254119 [Russula dissimulans]|nr:hypothetical protein BC827DRAFT_1254119 [Russula dissimulans]
MVDNGAIIMDYRNSCCREQYVGVAGFSVLLWDHIITFSDEVEFIWKGGKGPAVYLFLLNRYLIVFSFMVNLWAYFRTSWSLEVRSMTMIGISIADMMMFMRIRALYPRLWSIQVFVLSVFLTFVGVNSWLLSHGVPVPHPAYPLVDSCTMIIDPKIPGPLASSSAWLPLLYDTIVVSLTVIRTASSVISKNPSQMFRVLLREGLLYYSVIFAITLILTLMINFAPPSIRNITAQHLLFTVAMMSRITLHLRRFAARPNGVVQGNVAHPRFMQGRFSSFAPLTTLAAPSYATPAGQQDATFMQSIYTDSVPVPENESFLAMETFSKPTAADPPEEDRTHQA